ncbi:unnamed protein product, partial [Rotaria magnacalcarata]
MDNTLVLDEIRKLCQNHSKVRKTTKNPNDKPEGWKPLIIIIPLRLGL